MKGLVFNIFEEFIEENFGDDTWDLILDESGEEEDVFVGPKTYPDSIFMNLVQTAVKLKELKLEDAVRMFGKFSYSRLKGKLPDIMEDYSSPEEILFALDGIIHVEVRKLLEDANPPSFDVKREGKDIIMEYQSDRKLCFFVEGLLEGLALSFQKKVKYTQTECTHKGHDHCIFNIQFYE
jgi:predicted hydrocarbon binding protein